MTHFHSRKPLRLRHYDYASIGIYFVTICTQQRQCLFGKIDNSIMLLNANGIIAKQYWLETPQHFTHVQLDHFVLMPNHIHALLHIREENGAPLPIIIRSYKAAVTRQLQRPTWQRSYWERVIRNERELALTREYIANNPSQWGTDKAEDY
ncbi:MAG TPA: transposase [Serratia grimesii]|jgi:REP element-mobilizing transposase RayT|uniref:Transposase n=1 Tax=Serratia grimesii TaxID=82995 RepID=A0A9C7V7A0_9GAMM|nr:transposase [Serratia grimesii]CAI0787949.1 Transposase and inactivated derivatives [Serratia grimesii]CAI0871187.1 Transposase and inactivated derivatives [Serratia grimesii]CAI0901569.1 Transposase and inactivated derivatives [Serratia grimesii]CAI1608950.1 Transposase and inactivated derivatives [Serratia grimesii]CAI2415176.1 Transposase and inactivated derivatives [Serratia grimesii]